MGQYTALVPEIILSVLFLLYFVVGLITKKREINGGIVLAISIITALTLFSSYGTAFGGMFVADSFSQSLKLVFLINLFLCVLISLKYEKIRDELFYEYSLLMILSTLAMMLIVSSRDLIPLFLSVELMSLGVYLLSGFIAKDLRSNEASMKYYILGSFASAIFLFGIAALYGTTGTTNFSAILEALKNQTNLTVYHFAGVFAVLTALSFKAGCAPFHQWSPDVYEGAPTTVTAFMSVGPKAAAVGALGRLIFEGLSTQPQLWLTPLIFIALLTMAIGNILALRQNNIKRLLAYSSIAHAGYVMLAVLSSTPEGLSSIVFYMLVYAFMNIGAFAVVLALPEGERIEGYKGIYHNNPTLAICMLAFMFSLAGIPPFGGFIAKFLVFKAVIQAGYVWVALMGIIFSILSAYYYLRIVVKMFFTSPDTQQLQKYLIPSNLKLAILFNTIFILALGIIPDVFHVRIYY
ncbi:NADH-quinone oxidoreductase subunit N [Thermodesulfovibrio yellowstonii]|uniref:NADH-quinone oxidoreductase subunit N n=1 Tax=Thermodesulfovibrio yellowstonii TaxID=28262 RepID=A0A9W6LKI6_9BACT|nr:NADH-quinone oxidoreductase subunit N [Thermodesulfovibrio islandicus]GLI53659.1 NADH-quinone oxidoreductase subunit N 1 [Thermodesulfovibrio islandicus]